jgi:L-fucose isomerase-like protein
MNLYATVLDMTRLRSHLGPEVETFELHEIVQAMEALAAERVDEVVAWMRERWSFDRPLPTEDQTLATGARMFLALKDKAVDRRFEALTLVDGYGTKKLLGFPPGIVLALLSDLGGFASIPENDIAGAVTQLIVRSLTGQVGAYFEFYEFLGNDRLLIGVPDFVPAEVVEGDVHVVPWPGFAALRGGLLNVSKVKPGPVTICRLGPDGDKFQLHVAAGFAHPPRAWEEAGWGKPPPQLPSVEVELEDTSLGAFADRVLGQHYILVYGDHRDTLAAFCRLLEVTLT